MRTILCSLIISLFFCTIVFSEDYYPLREGNQWTYSVSNGVKISMKITGFTEVNGVRCAKMESTAESIMGTEESVEYLALDSDGIKAYKAITQGQEMIYEPPVVRIKQPYKQGETWTSTMEQFGITLTTAFEAVGTQEVLTEAGSFECIVIRSRIALPGQQPIVSESYYADGTGLVLQSIQVSGQTITTSLTSANIKPTEKSSTAPKPVIDSTKEILCPNCNAVLPADAKFCPECGEKITRPSPPKTLTNCPKCGAKLPEGAKFCPECGEKLSMPAGGNSQNTSLSGNGTEISKLEKYESQDGKLLLYKPQLDSSRRGPR